MNTEPILSFRQDAGFYEKQAERCRDRGDTPGLLRYLRLAADSGSESAAFTLAGEYLNLHCFQAADRVLEKLLAAGTLPPEGYSLLGTSAAAQGRYVTACRALERYLLYCPDDTAADTVEQMLSILDSRFCLGDRHAVIRSFRTDAWREGLLRNDLRQMKRFQDPFLSLLTEAYELIGQGEGARALKKLYQAEEKTGPRFLTHLLMFRAACLLHEPVTASAAMLSALPLCESLTDSLLLSLACEQAGRDRDALEIAEVWLKHFPDCAVFLLLASRLCGRIPGLGDRAAELRLRAAQIDPEAEAVPVTEAQTRLRDRLLLLSHHHGSTPEKRLYRTCCLISGGKRCAAIERSMKRSLCRMTGSMRARLEAENSAWRQAVTLQVLHTSGLPEFPPFTDLGGDLPRSLWRKLRHLSRVPENKEHLKGIERI